MAGLYIHVPFCLRKCRYCAFYSMARINASAVDLYLRALDLELGRLPTGYRPETVYIGGGTPTALSVEQLGRLLALVSSHVDLSRLVEWTCEANPGTLDAAKTALLRHSGVTRVSLGVQSFDARALSFLGRIHDARQSEESLRLLRESGIRNVSVDLIYGIPGCDGSVLAGDLERLIELRPQHVSCYCLSFEEGTPLESARKAGRIHEMSGDEQAAMYAALRAGLKAAGYRHYEISNFALPGYACRHNHLYWSGGEYIGCGPAAHSHRGRRRYANVADLEAWAAALFAGRAALAFEEELTPQAFARETLVMSLRRTRGLRRAEFRAVTGRDWEELCGEQIAELAGRGLLVVEGERLRLAEEALFVSDAVFRELI